MRALICALVMSSAFLSCGCVGNVEESSGVPVPCVRVSKIMPQKGDEIAGYAGDVRARYEQALAFQVGGRIAERRVDVGDTVVSGDVLMRLDPSDLNLAVSRAAAQVAAARSDFSLAQTNLARYRELSSAKVVSQNDMDNVENAWRLASSRLADASAAEREARRMLGYATLVTREAGVVAEIHAEAGQVVGAGQSVLVLVRTEEKEVEISVPEQRLDELRSAKRLLVSFWALPGVSVEGEVREIAPQADAVTRTYRARIALRKPPTDVRLGMTSYVNLSGDATGELYVPLSAIYQPGDVPSVWLLSGDVVILRRVSVGVFGDDKIQVISGLSSGDVVVTAGVHRLEEGQRVRIWEGGE